MTDRVSTTLTKPDGVHGDAGLQPERTTMAWVRTGALLAAVCLLLLRASTQPLLLTTVVIAVCAAPTLTILATAHSTHRLRVEALTVGSTPAPLLPVALLSGGVIALAGAALALLPL